MLRMLVVITLGCLLDAACSGERPESTVADGGDSGLNVCAAHQLTGPAGTLAAGTARAVSPDSVGLHIHQDWPGRDPSRGRPAGVCRGAKLAM